MSFWKWLQTTTTTVSMFGELDLWANNAFIDSKGATCLPHDPVYRSLMEVGTHNREVQVSAWKPLMECRGSSPIIEVSAWKPLMYKCAKRNVVSSDVIFGSDTWWPGLSSNVL